MMMELADIKKQLYGLCQAYVDERIERIRLAIDEAQKAANHESKSSAGDKYETGRAMMQLEKEKHAAQLSEALKLKKVMDQLLPDKYMTKAALGSLIKTNQGYFYLSIGAGKLKVEGQDFFAVAPTAPLAKKLIGLGKGEATVFNGRNFEVEDLA